MQKSIQIRGARTHNLRNINLDLPRNQLIVITGLSGSGKSSLAFDTLYAEGQRRYVESLSSYARQFLSVMEKPDVDHIDGLSPTISIEQKTTTHNPRSTVGTLTDIYDYLRLLYARIGQPFCPRHNLPLCAQTVQQMVDRVLQLDSGRRLMLLAPVAAARKGQQQQLLENLRAQGFTRVRVDREIMDLDPLPPLRANTKHTIEVVVDRFRVRDGMRLRLSESFETVLQIADGRAIVAAMDAGDDEELLFSAKFSCPEPECDYSAPELEPRLFSFNNPAGACSACDGLGVQTFFDVKRIVRQPQLSLPAGAIHGWDRHSSYYLHLIQGLAAHYDFDLEQPFAKLPEAVQDVILHGSGKDSIAFAYADDRGRVRQRRHPFEGIVTNLERRYHETGSNTVREALAKYIATKPCSVCDGARVGVQARHVRIADCAIHQLTAMPIKAVVQFFDALTLDGMRATIAQRILHETRQRLKFLLNIGLDYLSLDRAANTLSGGEAQRIRLASQIGAGLVGVLYILDEPSIGLHPRDHHRLLDNLVYLRDLGNTIVVIEHDEDTMRFADHVVDIGPGAGVHGGHVVASGRPFEVANNPDSLTGQYLNGQRSIPIPAQRAVFDKARQLILSGASGNNLKGIELHLPVGLMICVCGVSGSGKSTLINDTLYRAMARKLGLSVLDPAAFVSISGSEHFNRVVVIDQTPIGRTPRSNPATYTGLFSPIRELFANTPEARSRGYTPGRFSFNVRGGRCETCSGDGVIKVEMHFLADLYVPCDICHEQRFNRETLDIRYKGKTIHEVLTMDVETACGFFSAVPVVARKLQTLMDVGLSYICLGQRATTLSGGEAQRIKLARELSKRDTGSTLYILDEPTTGLHFYDVEQLLSVLHRLRNNGNTIVVIEHNLDVIKTADWVIDLGPEGGDAGGRIIAAGTPEAVAAATDSATGAFLRKALDRSDSNSERRVG